jgi:hypothetical protein
MLFVPAQPWLVAAAYLCTQYSFLCRVPACLQRLLEENIEQQRMLEQLVVRLDAVERALQAMQEQRNKKSMFGGFLGPRGL